MHQCNWETDGGGWIDGKGRIVEELRACDHNSCTLQLPTSMDTRSIEMRLERE